MKVKDVMTKNPACCTPESTLTEAARMMADRDCGEIPVVADQAHRRPVGVITDRDIAIRAVARGKSAAGMTVREVMSSPAVTVTPEMDLGDCCQTLEHRQLRRVPVVDAQGACCGIVSQADIAQRAPAKMTAAFIREISQRGRA